VYADLNRVHLHDPPHRDFNRTTSSPRRPSSRSSTLRTGRPWIDKQKLAWSIRSARGLDYNIAIAVGRR